MGVFDFFKKSGGGNDLEAVVNPKKKKDNFLSQFLPDDPDKKEALARSLILGGAGMMAAGGPSATPTNFMSALGQGLAGGVVGYDKAMATNAASAKSRAEANAKDIAVQFASSIGSPNGDNGYSVEQLQQILKYQIATGDEAGTRDTLGMIQKLQQTGAANGMVVGKDGFELAPGYAGSLFDTKSAESRGSAVGDNLKKTNDQKNFEYGNENPDFRKYETEQKKANSTNVTVSTAPKDGEIWKAMDKERENAAGSAASLGLVYEMKHNLPNAITGFGSDYLLTGRKAIAALGGDSSKVVDTETLKTQAMELAAKMKGDLVGNQQISDSDMKFVQQVAAGDTKLDSGTIGHLIDLREKQLKGNVQRYNSRVDQLYPDTADNQTNRNYFGGIVIPENPYAKEDQNRTGDSGGAAPKSGRVVVKDGFEYFIGPDGKKYKRPL